MLKMTHRCVGAAFFGIVSALVSGLCFGIRAWWPAGIFLVAAFACLCWCSRGALFINEVLTRYYVPLEGDLPKPGPPYPAPEAPSRPSTVPCSRRCLSRGADPFAEGTRMKGGVSERPEGPRPSKPKGQGGGRLN